MRVYHFINEEFGLKSLEDRRLKISRIMQLNDPFEFLCVALSDKNLRRKLSSAKAILDQYLGLICFSKTWKNPVQWSHYAERHKGLCLGFDVPDNKVVEIQYVENRIEPTNDAQLVVRELLRFKYSHWSYEQEVRVFEKLEKNEGGLYFKNFSDDLVLKEVIVGASSKIKRNDIAERLGLDSSKIEAFKARAAFRKFEVTKNLNKKAWV